MRNIKLVLEYDGTDFFGWQRQDDVRTVQRVLEDATRSIFDGVVKITGAGRTDAGVHAESYVCNFHVDSPLAPERMVAALNARLPDDVVVSHAAEVPESFHARFDAVSRAYVYRMTAARSALRRRSHHYCRYRLDVSAMERAAVTLVGKHDFTSFTPTENDNGAICDVTRADISALPDGTIMLAIEANRFVHHMVRIIIGTLIEVGRGKIGPEQMAVILRTRDRRAAGPTAPARGLTLVAVRYDRD